MRNLFHQRGVVVGVLVLVLLVIGAVFFRLSMKPYFVPDGAYAVKVYPGGSTVMEILTPGKHLLWPWESPEQIRSMGTVNTLVGIASSRRRFVIEGDKLTAKTSVAYVPTLMQTAEGTSVLVYYTIWTQRDPAKLATIYDYQTELRAVVDTDTWVDDEVKTLHDAQIADTDHRDELAKTIKDVVTPKLANYGFEVVYFDFHIQFAN